MSDHSRASGWITEILAGGRRVAGEIYGCMNVEQIPAFVEQAATVEM
ncbi:MAG: hypothetical protein PHV02_16900 [Rhodocyclaceae bacterium]|nr:hypothetical protein [Rhodocyclaceae bacterium]